MLIRPATIDDALAIATVQLASWRVGYAGILDEDVLSRINVQERMQKWQPLLQDAAVLVAQQQQDIVGFCALATPSRDRDLPDTVTEITALYVHPHWWRQGVARELLAATREQTAGQAALSLWVLVDNERGRAFYHSQGFTADGNQQVHPGSGKMTQRMLLPLTP